jgi:aminoglycoside phosphotransferase (APT) family kinase protein
VGGRFTFAADILLCSWEMSTIGHPLSDLVNLLTPYATARLLTDHPLQAHLGSEHEGSTSAEGAALTVNPSFLPGATAGLPTLEECARQYAEAAGWDPTEGSQLSWALAFGIFRLASICQGIAARYALRQASSEWAVRHAEAREPLARFAWFLVQEIQGGGKAKI